MYYVLYILKCHYKEILHKKMMVKRSKNLKIPYVSILTCLLTSAS